MSRSRVIALAVLLVIPFVCLAGLGSYYLWFTGLGLYVWWPMTLCMAVGYGLGWYWARKRQLLPPVDFTAPLHWTDRDRQASQIVQTRAEACVKLPAERLQELDFYLSGAQQMA